LSDAKNPEEEKELNGPDGIMPLGPGVNTDRNGQWYQFLIIKEKQKWKAVFDMIVNFVVLYNCAMITMNLCYDITPKGAYKYISDFCEVMFGLDILFQFVQEYKDSET
jgi:hypothetical protein